MILYNIFITLAIILTIVAFVLLFTKFKYKGYCSLVIIIFLAIISASIIPSIDMDLYRYYEKVDIYVNLPIINFLKDSLFMPEFLFNFICYIIAKLNIFSILPAIFCFFGYLISIYILSDYMKNKKVNNVLQGILYSFLLIYNLLFYIVGIRSVLAILIFCLAIYLDFFKNKKGIGYKLIYILPCLIHISGFFLLGAIIIYYIYRKINKKYIIYGFLGIFVLVGILSKLIPDEWITYNNTFISYLLVKFETYNVATNIFQDIYTTFRIVLLVLLTYLSYKNYKINTENKRKYEIILYLNFFVIATLTYYFLYYRLIDLVIILNIITVIDCYLRIKTKKQKIIFNSIIAFFIIIMILPQYFNMKTLNYGRLMENPIFNKVIEIYKK